MATLTFRAMGISIRCVDMGRAGLGAMRRQFGHEQPHAERPDLTVLFADRFAGNRPSSIGPDAAWDGRCFVVRQPGGWLELPFTRLGNFNYELRCDRTVTDLPLLRALVRLVAIHTGLLPIHGSAFALAEYGVVATGYPAAGKTGILLAALESGGRAISAENACIEPRSGHLIPSSERVRVRPRHLRQAELNGLHIASGMRRRLLITSAAVGIAERLRIGGAIGARIRAAAVRRNTVDIDAVEPGQLERTRVAALVFLTSVRGANATIKPLDETSAARKILALYDHDMQALFDYFLRYCYATLAPGPSPLQAARIQYRELVARLIGFTPCFEALHDPERVGQLVRIITSLDATLSAAVPRKVAW